MLISPKKTKNTVRLKIIPAQEGSGHNRDYSKAAC